MPAAERTPSGVLVLPRPNRRLFAAPATEREPLLEEAAALDAAAQSVAAAPSDVEQLGRLSASVAHDFNNILSVIMVCAGEIADEAVDGVQAERAAEIRAAAERGADLSRRLLSHDRVCEPPGEALAIDAAIVDAMPLLRRTLGAETEITLTSEGHLPCVGLASGELERMLVNLAANARDAMASGGSVEIGTAMVAIPAGDPCLGAGWWLRVSFSDTGTGMSPEVARRAVQPYFSTKPGHGGSGLGLASVHALARARGGDLRISAAPGSGTTISLYLPAVRSTGEPLALSREPAAATS